jgi:hypothetical protein
MGERPKVRRGAGNGGTSPEHGGESWISDLQFSVFVFLRIKLKGAKLKTTWSRENQTGIRTAAVRRDR